MVRFPEGGYPTQLGGGIYSSIASGKGGGQGEECPLDRGIFAKNEEKEGNNWERGKKSGKRGEKIRKRWKNQEKKKIREEKAKIGKVLSLCPS